MSRAAALHFCASNRAWAVGQLKAYALGVQSKLMPSFDQIEDEAEAFAQAEYERLGRMPGWEGGPDLAEIADIANDAALSHYVDLVFVKGQLFGLAIAGLYHLWERLLKEFIVRELGKGPWDEISKKKTVDEWTFENLRGLLELVGFDIRERGFFRDLNVLRLITNTVKHGDGISCRELADEAPELFDRMMHDTAPSLFSLKAADLSLEPKHFDQFAKAVVDFWHEMPELLVVSTELDDTT